MGRLQFTTLTAQLCDSSALILGQSRTEEWLGLLCSMAVSISCMFTWAHGLRGRVVNVFELSLLILLFFLGSEFGLIYIHSKLGWGFVPSILVGGGVGGNIGLLIGIGLVRFGYGGILGLRNERTITSVFRSGRRALSRAAGASLRGSYFSVVPYCLHVGTSCNRGVFRHRLVDGASQTNQSTNIQEEMNDLVRCWARRCWPAIGEIFIA